MKIAPHILCTGKQGHQLIVGQLKPRLRGKMWIRDLLWLVWLQRLVTALLWIFHVLDRECLRVTEYQFAVRKVLVTWIILRQRLTSYRITIYGKALHGHCVTLWRGLRVFRFTPWVATCNSQAACSLRGHVKGVQSSFFTFVMISTTLPDRIGHCLTLILPFIYVAIQNDFTFLLAYCPKRSNHLKGDESQT